MTLHVLRATANPRVLDGHWVVFGRRFPRKLVFPVGMVLFAAAGIFSPLFDLNAVHGPPSFLLYAQHLFFDGIADAGGFWAATFCKHKWHQVAIATAFALASTFALITIVG
jgi:hypothetical protein